MRYPLQKLDGAVESRLVAALFDNGTGMRHRSAVTAEKPADVGQIHAELDMAEVHRHLPGQGHPRAAARRDTQPLGIDIERFGDGLLEEFPIQCGGRAAGGQVERTKTYSSLKIDLQMHWRILLCFKSIIKTRHFTRVRYSHDLN